MGRPVGLDECAMAHISWCNAEHHTVPNICPAHCVVPFVSPRPCQPVIILTAQELGLLSLQCHRVSVRSTDPFPIDFCPHNIALTSSSCLVTAWQLISVNMEQYPASGSSTEYSSLRLPEGAGFGGFLILSVCCEPPWAGFCVNVCFHSSG